MSFASIQQGHVTPIANQTVLPVRTGGDVVLASKMDSKYASVAIEDGVVTKVSKSKILVTYKSGKKESYTLGIWTGKEEGGSTYLHNVVTNLRIRDKFKAGHVIAYDEMFFEQDIFDKTKVALKTGILLNTMLLETQDTYEDSAAISTSASKHLKMGVVKTKSFVIPGTTIIKNMLNIEDKVDYDTELFTMLDNVDETVDAIDVSEDTLDILADIKNKTPLAKVKGIIKKIQILYNTELSNMSNSLKKLAQESDIRLMESTGKEFTGKVSGGYSVNGKSLPEGSLEIKLYIDTSNDMALGDKMILGNQLKCTVGNIFPDDTVCEDGTVVDAKFSRRSISARIVNSPDIIGSASSALKQLTKKAIEGYFE